MHRFLLTAVLTLVTSMVLAACSSATAQSISPQDYVTQFSEPAAPHVLIDVRTPQEFASGHIAGAINIPVDQIASRLSEIPTDMPVIVYCRSGTRSARAQAILAQNDYTDLYDLGGIIAWQSAGYPIQ